MSHSYRYDILDGIHRFYRWNDFLSRSISAIVYELLYKNVFKLPDVEYSVETMLHNAGDPELSGAYTLHDTSNDHYASHIVLGDGQKFQLDKPGEIVILVHRMLSAVRCS